jgi:nitroreductase
MNDVINNINSRRSHRGYQPQQIKDGELTAIIDAGLNAPSARNMQNWHFTVIRSKELIDGINGGVKSRMGEKERERWASRPGGFEAFDIFYGAPAVVVLSGVKGDRYSLINCSIAMQNMCLAAESLGIGSCMIGMVSPLFDSPEGEPHIAKLNIPEGYHPQFAATFGYKKDEPRIPERIPNKVNYID